MNAAWRTALFVVVIHGLFLVAAPFLAFSFFEAPRPVSLLFRLAGAAVFAAGAWLYGACVQIFPSEGLGTPAAWDPPTRFIRSGFYRWTRNPMYVGMFTMLAGEALFFGSWVLWVYTAGLWISFHLFVLLHEEPALRKKFGAEYETYLKSVPRWIPRVDKGDKR